MVAFLTSNQTGRVQFPSAAPLIEGHVNTASLNLYAIGKRLSELTQSFLPEYLVMVDCEMTGVIPERDSLLQVAMLKLKLDNNRYVVDGEPLNEFLQYGGKPSNEFHRTYLTHIFEKCNESSLSASELKQKIHEWLGNLKGKVMPVGVEEKIFRLHKRGANPLRSRQGGSRKIPRNPQEVQSSC